jgi:hypothetical protein
MNIMNMEKVDKVEVIFHLALYSLMLAMVGIIGYEFWNLSGIFLHAALA